MEGLNGGLFKFLFKQSLRSGIFFSRFSIPFSIKLSFHSFSFFLSNPRLLIFSNYLQFSQAFEALSIEY